MNTLSAEEIEQLFPEEVCKKAEEIQKEMHLYINFMVGKGNPKINYHAAQITYLLMRLASIEINLTK